MKHLYLESEIEMPVMKLPLRCTLMKTNQGVVMFSPFEFSAEQIQQIARFGEVTAIVAPSVLHHLYIEQAHRIFPQAVLWATPGLEEKCPQITWNKILTRDPWPFENEIDLLLVRGVPRMTEVAFFCKETKTLLVTDLCFNLKDLHGLGAKVLTRLMGTYEHFAVSRLLKRFMNDRVAFQESMDRLMKWDFDTVVMAHGQILAKNGKARLAEALRERHLE